MAALPIIDSDSDDEILTELFVRMRKEKNVRRRPNYFDDYNDSEFTTRFRLSKEAVLRLLDLINDQIEHMTDRNESVPPMNQLLLTLRYFACGDFLVCVGDFIGIDKGTASRIIKRVSESIACLAPTYIKFPSTQEEIGRTQECFFKIGSFPRVTGAIDCTHIRIKSPGGENAEDYRGRKGYFSFNVQTVANYDLKIMDIVCRWPGSAHDQTIFNNSSLKARFERGDMGNRILLGDSGYAASNHILTPVAIPRTRAEHLYNEAHIRTRNVVERSYGVWKRRFPVLAQGIRLNTDRVEAVVIACAVLHNIAVEMNEVLPELDPVFQEAIEMCIANERQQDEDIQDNGQNATRNNFIQYFNSLL